MNISTKFMCCYMMVWIAGCTSKFKNVQISNLDHTVDGLCCTPELAHKKNIISDSNISFNSSNKHYIINSNRYAYNCMNKGSYSSHFYKVQPGDTLFYIAWITGNNYHVLAKKNNIAINGTLKVGQVLQVGGQDEYSTKKSLKKHLRNHIERNVKTHYSSLNTSKLNNVSPNRIHHNDDVGKYYVFDQSSVNLSDRSKKNGQKLNNIPKHNSTLLSNSKKIILNTSSNMKKQLSISWGWPAVGRIVSTFSSSEGGNKGIDISGMLGQPVFAASHGKVVYTGNALSGYGNLIIIKHDKDFLSTYAHNDKILVVERQNVILGQKIATMGNSESDITKLRFEVRYKGKSVNPLCYLPKRQG